MVRRAVVLAVFVFFGVTGPGMRRRPRASWTGRFPCGVVTDEGSGGSAVSTSPGAGLVRHDPPSDNTSATVTPAIESVHSTAKTTDGVPLDINFAMPTRHFRPAPYPTLMAFHGYGGNRFSFRAPALARQGLRDLLDHRPRLRRVLPERRLEGRRPGGLRQGYIHLIDQRFEIRDTQNFIGNLVDEGLVQPDGLAAWGVSYGGGHTLSFAAFKDRMMNLDGTLVPWTSPDGTPINIKAAVAQVPRPICPTSSRRAVGTSTTSPIRATSTRRGTAGRAGSGSSGRLGPGPCRNRFHRPDRYRSRRRPAGLAGRL